MKKSIVLVMICIVLLSLTYGCNSVESSLNENVEEKLDEATLDENEVDNSDIDNNDGNETNSNLSDSKDEEEVIEPTIELDIASSGELITDLLSNIDYTEVYNEYKKYYSINDIERIQNLLQSSGVNCGAVDGYIGKKTVASVVHFQMFHDLSITGIVDERTASKLHLDYEDLDAYLNKYGKFVTFSLEKSYLSYNNSVGNEWGTSVEVDGTNIKYGTHTISMKKGDSVRIDVAASENDKVVDYGSNSGYVYYDDIEKGYYYTLELEVLVSENRGRYSGNTAKWIFVIRIDVE